MLSYTLVYIKSLRLISTDIKRYNKQKITGTIIKYTVVSQACFTKTQYWTLVNLGNCGLQLILEDVWGLYIALSEGYLEKKMLPLANRSRTTEFSLFDSILFLKDVEEKAVLSSEPWTYHYKMLNFPIKVMLLLNKKTLCETWVTSVSEFITQFCKKLWEKVKQGVSLKKRWGERRYISRITNKNIASL